MIRIAVGFYEISYEILPSGVRRLSESRDVIAKRTSFTGSYGGFTVSFMNAVAPLIMPRCRAFDSLHRLIDARTSHHRAKFAV
jgi:hypothetical protein